MFRKWGLITVAAAFVLALFTLAVQAQVVQAGPPAPVDIVIDQPDGTRITARQWGDEWQNGLETVQGYTLLQDESTGYWVYAERQADGRLVPALVGQQMLRAGIDAPDGLPQHARPALPGRPAPEAPALEPQLLEEINLARTGITGDQKLLVILVSFADQPNQYSATTYRDRAFGATNSVRHFYQQASANQLNFIPAAESFADASGGAANDGVVGWLPLGIEHPNPYLLTADISQILARAALNAANPYVQFNSFDANSDGYVTANELHILIVAAGCEASTGSCPGEVSKIWAHQYNLDSTPLTLDGVLVGRNTLGVDWIYGGYAIIGETHYEYVSGSYQPYAATVGTMVHELGHLLAWPDLYDTSGYTNGVGNWSVMSGGSWNSAGGKPGSSPALPDAFLKWYQGWISPVQAPLGVPTMLSSLSVEQTLLIGSNPNGVDWDFDRTSGTGEYWLLEKRSRVGYDAGLPAAGLLLWHIDETSTETNQANNYAENAYHRLVALEQADGRDDLFFKNNRGDSGDPYPGSSGNLVWNTTSNPNSLYNALDGTAIAQPSGFSMLIETDITKTYLPVVMAEVPITGRLTSNGTSAGGQEVVLRYTTNSGASYTTFATTTTDPGGNFTFRMPPLYRVQQAYYIYWRNNNDNQSWLGDFYGHDITNNTPSHHHEINIANVRLVSPASGASVGVPTTFVWAKRPTTSDKYYIGIINEANTEFASTTGGSYTDRVTVGAAPSWVVLNAKNYWFVIVETPAGFGYSYWMNAIYYNDITPQAPQGAPLGGTSSWQGTHPNPALLPKPQ